MDIKTYKKRKEKSSWKHKDKKGKRDIKHKKREGKLIVYGNSRTKKEKWT